MTFEGIDKLNEDIDKLIEHKKLKTYLRQSITTVANQSASQVPVRTGHLKRSQVTKIENEGMAGEVAFTADYAIPVEEGHATKGGGFVAGRHFLKPVFEIEKQKFMSQASKGEL